jgi:Tol biopolymer transport system component/DNA-binding winged helix-turn-helix (wHTH) protein
MTKPQPRFYEFGEFRLDSLKRTLQKDGDFIPLKGKAFDLLLFLVTSNGQILTHEQILDVVWEGTFVEQANLKKNISTLRKVLDEQPDASNYIQTLPKKGYRFVADVHLIADEQRTGFDKVSQPLSNLAVTNLAEIDVSDEANKTIHQTPFDISNFPQNKPAQIPQTKFPFRRLLLVAMAVLAVGSGLFGYWVWKNWRTNLIESLKLDNIKLQKLPMAANVQTTCISPDGKIAVYATIEEGDKQALWMRRLGSPNILQLVPPAEIDYRAIVISPDNNFVYYGVTIKNTIDYLYQIPILGGVPRKIVEGIHSPVSFSSDGKRIAFVRDDPKGRTLYTVNATDGGDEKEVFTAPDAHKLINPRYSPDGQNFAFIMGEQTPQGRLWSLAEMPVNGGKIRNITKPQKNKIFDFAWLLDESGFLVTAEPSSVKLVQLFRVSYPSGEISKLTNDFLDYEEVSLSADGKNVLALQKERVGHIWSVDTATLNDPTRLNAIQNPLGKFTLLPNGQLLYVTIDGGQRGLFVADADGNNSRNFTAQFNSERDPAISFDNKSVVFISKISGNDEIWQSDINGGNLRQLTDEKTFITTPQLSSDEKTLYFERFDETAWHLIQLSPDSKQTSLVFDETVSDFDLSPDGKLIAYGFYNNAKKKWNVAIRNLADNTVQKTFDIAAATFLRWTSDGKGLIYNISDVSREGGNIWLQPLDGSPPKLYLDAKPQKIYTAEFSPDGKKLFYMRGVTTSGMVLIKAE